MGEHVILVAFQVNGDTRSEAMENLRQDLIHVDLVNHPDGVEAWWIAEDDRNDGSDCDSAVFVHPGQQVEANRALWAAGLTPRCNLRGVS